MDSTSYLAGSIQIQTKPSSVLKMSQFIDEKLRL